MRMHIVTLHISNTLRKVMIRALGLVFRQVRQVRVRVRKRKIIVRLGLEKGQVRVRIIVRLGLEKEK